MKFSYQWLKECSGFAETPQKLAELLTMHAFEIERMEHVGNDTMLDVKILPNRVADASGHHGLAREIATIKKLKSKNEKNPFTANRLLAEKIIEDRKFYAKNALHVVVENYDDCARYSARVMRNVSVKPSPSWLRRRLEVCGIQSINNIVDAANYVMLETGQPLHVFDAEKLQHHGTPPKTIHIRRAHRDERLHALDDNTYILNPDILVIADEMQPIAIAGIKGGADSGVFTTTTSIILESANFNPVLIRKASQSLHIKTDASYRFEHGLDPNQTKDAVDRLAGLIQRVAGGIIAKGIVDIYSTPFVAPQILFRPEYAMQLIGHALPHAFMNNTLQYIGCAIRTQKNAWLVTPPTFRRDLLIEEDLIEEVARHFGYERIVSAPPQVPAITSHATAQEIAIQASMRQILFGAGYTETFVYEFTGEKELALFRIDPAIAIAIENPINPENAYLAPRLLAKLVIPAIENTKHCDTVLLFGTGKSFTQTGRRVQERNDVVLARAIKKESGAEGFYELKGTIDQLLESFRITDHWYDDAIENNQKNIFHPYRAAQIRVDDLVIGCIGALHPEIAATMKFKGHAYIAELYLDQLIPRIESAYDYQHIAKYPAVMRDIALIVPNETKVDDVLEVIETSAGELLIDADLFDYFQDDAMRADEQKSFAFHLIFQSPERTLHDDEINETLRCITRAIETKSWKVR